MGQRHEGPVMTPPTGQPAIENLRTAIPEQRRPAPGPAPQPESPQPESPQPDSPRPASPPGTPAGVRTCTCGHPEDMHEHYRAGRDCGACGPQDCPSFRDADEPVGRLRRLLYRVRRR